MVRSNPDPRSAVEARNREKRAIIEAPAETPTVAAQGPDLGVCH
jgi:hypothetical protein